MDFPQLGQTIPSGFDLLFYHPFCHAGWRRGSGRRWTVVSNGAIKPYVDPLGIGNLMADILTFRRELKRNASLLKQQSGTGNYPGNYEFCG